MDLPQLRQDVVGRVLEEIGVDAEGLRPLDRRYLEMLRRRGRPIGVARLAAMIGASRHVLREIVEPFLLRRGLITFTPRGRALAG